MRSQGKECNRADIYHRAGRLRKELRLYCSLCMPLAPIYILLLWPYQHMCGLLQLSHGYLNVCTCATQWVCVLNMSSGDLRPEPWSQCPLQASLCLVFWDRISLSSPGWPWTCLAFFISTHTTYSWVMRASLSLATHIPKTLYLNKLLWEVRISIYKLLRGTNLDHNNPIFTWN